MTKEIEWFDVVDINDHVIDKKPRDQVHQLGLMHRAVHCLVFNHDETKLFLQKRAMTKDTNPGLWDTSVGGHVDSGESYDAAMIREANEELGIDKNSEFIALYQLTPKKENGYEFIWVYKLSSEGPFQCCEEEIEQGQWCDIEFLKTDFVKNKKRYTETLLLIWQLYMDAQHGE